MRIGVITCEKCKQLAPSEQSLVPLLVGAGATVTPLVWNDPAVIWMNFDLLLIRSIWDYHLHPEQFVQWLNHLEENKISTWNPVDILRRNHHKFYLRDLRDHGVDIIPTLFVPKTPDLRLTEVVSNGWKRAVIKPAISASGYMTRVFDASALPEIESQYRRAAAVRDFLVQKFMPAVEESGELSMIFFNRVFSHAVLKKPKTGEFRVQEEHGGQTSSTYPDINIIRAAERILSLFEQDLLYARVDGLVVNGKFVLMEVELIEPELFLGSHPEARKRFVNSILALPLIPKRKP